MPVRPICPANWIDAVDSRMAPTARAMVFDCHHRRIPELVEL
jgi:hypothetical protein